MMGRTTVSVALAGLVLSASPLPVRADALNDWLTGDSATGDWGGLRTTLEEVGITLEGASATVLMAVRTGNAGSGDGWACAGRIDFGVDLDVEKLAGLSGFSFAASGA